ncbi:hypothetical protein D3C72_971580 [compost metagenome]
MQRKAKADQRYIKPDNSCPPEALRKLKKVAQQNAGTGMLLTLQLNRQSVRCEKSKFQSGEYNNKYQKKQ